MVFFLMIFDDDYNFFALLKSLIILLTSNRKNIYICHKILYSRFYINFL